MAHLSGLVGESSDDRGQLLVVGAFAIALLIVALAVTLNAAAYTETLSTEGDSGVAQDAIRFERDVDQSVAGTMLAVSRQGDADEGDLVTVLDEWETKVNEDGATRGVVADVRVVGPTTYGSRISQENESRGFADANGTANWTVVNGTGEVAQFRLTLNRSTLTNESEPDPFTVTATSGADAVTATFVDNGTGINATVVDPTGATTTCGVATNATAVNFVAGTLGNESCAELAFGDVLGTDDYTVAFADVGNSTGTFELVVRTAVSPDARFDAATGPTLTQALWSTEVRLSYDTARVSYETKITVYVEGADA